jgi:hypothetical protein
MFQHQRQILPRRKLLQPNNIHLIARPHLIIIRRIRKRQRKHTLLLQIRLVDPRKRAHDDRETAEESRLQRGMLAGGAFTVVVVTDDDPFDALVAVGGCYLGYAAVFAC